MTSSSSPDSPEHAALLDDVGDRLDAVTLLVRMHTAAAVDEGEVTALATTQRRIEQRLLHAPALSLFETSLELTDTEMTVVWLLAAVACRLEVRATVGRLVPNEASGPTLDTIRSLAYGESPSEVPLVELSDRGSLRGLQIVERTDRGASDAHESVQTWGLSRHVLGWLHGIRELDPTLSRIATLRPAMSPRPAADDLALALDDVLTRGQHAVLLDGRASIYEAVVEAADRAGRRLVEVHCARLANEPAIAAQQLQVLARECRLHGRAPLLVGLEALGAETIATIGDELVRRIRSPVLAVSGKRLAVAWAREVLCLSAPPLAAPKPPPRSVVDRRLDWARRLIARAASAYEPDPTSELEGLACRDAEQAAGHPLAWLWERLGLGASEEQILWVLLAHELCPIARQQLRELNTERVVDVTWDTLRRVVFGPAPAERVWQELGPHGRLHRLLLLERTDVGEAPEQRRTYRVARRVLALVYGDVQIDGELATLASLPEPVAQELVGDPDSVRRIESAVDRDGPGLVLVAGQTGVGRRSLLLAALGRAGRGALVVTCRAISKEPTEAARQFRLIERECRLHGRVLVFRDLEALRGSFEIPDRLDLVDAVDLMVLGISSRPIARRWRHPCTTIELPPTTSLQRAALWKLALPRAAVEDVEILTATYPVAPAFIVDAARVAVHRCGDADLAPEHIEYGVQSVLDDRIRGLATRVTTKLSWDDIVLPREQMTAIVELVGRVRQRDLVYERWGFGSKLGKGLGTIALFSGPPGTGKTMTASLIAKELGVELYQVDLTKIVSKWIGETEQNLAKLFDAAESGHAMLLFDEGDALFGKRTEVRSSNDRHANQEVNFLLQRLETFTGICVLTTNHENALDAAFQRRLSVHVRFTLPEPEERARLWRTLLPTEAPTDNDLEFADLGKRYVMSGGHIRNAVLRAAFFAAEDGGIIQARHLALAAQLEYEALGKIA